MHRFPKAIQAHSDYPVCFFRELSFCRSLFRCRTLFERDLFPHVHIQRHRPVELNKSGTTASASRVSAAVSYLRLLVALVTRAPTSTEAAVRARVLLPALVSTIGTQMRALHGDDCAPTSTSTGAPGDSSGDRTDSSSAGTQQGCGSRDNKGEGVGARTAASDSVVLCMQTLRYLVGWSEQSPLPSSSEGAKKGSGKSSLSPVGGPGSSKGDRPSSARGGGSGTSAPPAVSGKAGVSSPRDKQTKGTRRQNGAAGADVGKGPTARAVAERNAATRKAVERVCQEVIAGAFSSSAPAASEASKPEAVADMQVDDAANLALSSPAPGVAAPAQAGARAGPASTRVGNDIIGAGSDNIQNILCSLVQMALEVAGSSPPRISPNAPSSSPPTGSATSSASANTNAMANANLGGGGDGRGGGGGASSSPPPRRPNVLVIRRWGTEEDGDDDQEGVLIAMPRSAGTARSAAGALVRAIDSNAAAAAAVMAAAAGTSNVGASSGSAVGTPAAAAAVAGTAAAAGPSSPEVLQALMSELLGQVVDVEQGVGGYSGGVHGGVSRGSGQPPRAPVRARGATKDKHGGAGVTTDKSQGKKPTAAKGSRTAGGGDEKGGSSGKRKLRGSGGGTGGAPTAGTAPATSSRGGSSGAACKVGNETPATAAAAAVSVTTTAEVLAKLNAALRTPALAVLASALQLATVSVPHVCIRRTMFSCISGFHEIHLQYSCVFLVALLVSLRCKEIESPCFLIGGYENYGF